MLNALADELDITLGVRTVAAIRDELTRLGHTATKPAGTPFDTPFEAAPPLMPPPGHALLSTWPEALDARRGQDGDEYLPATAKPARALLSAATAAEIGVVEGEEVSVATDTGTLVLPVVIAEMLDRVVWVPTNARGYPVRATLGIGNGSLVTLTRCEAPPVIGAAAQVYRPSSPRAEG